MIKEGQAETENEKEEAEGMPVDHCRATTTVGGGPGGDLHGERE